jgi:nitroreductase
LADYDKVIRDYYLSRTGGNKDMSWSEQIAGMLVKEARPHMLEFLKARGYLLK